MPKETTIFDPGCYFQYGWVSSDLQELPVYCLKNSVEVWSRRKV